MSAGYTSIEDERDAEMEDEVEKQFQNSIKSAASARSKIDEENKDDLQKEIKSNEAESVKDAPTSIKSKKIEDQPAKSEKLQEEIKSNRSANKSLTPSDDKLSNKKAASGQNAEPEKTNLSEKASPQKPTMTEMADNDDDKDEAKNSSHRFSEVKMEPSAKSGRSAQTS